VHAFSIQYTVGTMNNKHHEQLLEQLIQLQNISR
jgi:hypothetical protein